MPFRDTSTRSLKSLRSPNATERLLRRVFFRDWNLKLLALAITLGLWFAVSGQRTHAARKFRNVQLHFQLPGNMEISNEARDEINLTLSGPESDLDLMSASDLTATIDVSDRSAGERIVQLTPGRLKLDLPSGVMLEKIEPGSIQLRLEPVIERELEVEPRVEGKLAEGYELRQVSVNPVKIHARGPASHINALAKAPTETISLEGRHQSFSLPQTSIDIPDARVVVVEPAVDVFIEIQPLKPRK